MIILDKNKDYYDYIAGIEGRDTDLIFDRRGSVKISKEIAPLLPKVGEKFEIERLKEKKREFEIEYFLMIGDWAGCLHHSVLLDSDGIVTAIGEGIPAQKRLPRNDWPADEFIKKIGRFYLPGSYIVKEFDNRYVRRPSECIYTEFTISYQRWGSKRSFAERRYDWQNAVYKHWSNPILAGTKFASLFSALEAWDHISEYLLSKREKPIVDNRTDIEKLEAAGFDKVTSFRNM